MSETNLRQSRPRGKYWIPKELHQWPEIQEVGLPAVGLFVHWGCWAARFGTDLLVEKEVRKHGDIARRLAAVGLWSTDGARWRVRSMGELRAGRGRPGLIMRVDKSTYDNLYLVGPRALGLWAVAASWSLVTDDPGFIPSDVARQLGKAKSVGLLWEHGLWSVSEHGFRMSKGNGLYQMWALARDDERADIPPALRQLVYERDGYQCVDCAAVDDLTLDHIVPWSWGGTDTYGNLRTLCRSCNSSKGDRFE